MRISSFLLLLFLSLPALALLPQERIIQSIYERAVPSVVHITNIQKVGGLFYQTKEVPAGMGSGFVWDRQGHIVTNYHVVNGAKELEVRFHNDEKKYKAKVIGLAQKKDIAVIKLIDKPRYLKPLSIGRSDNLKVGHYSIAIGNPFGLKHSMSLGIISALGRSIQGVGGVDIQGMIQTDAAINQGNSGGPLMNSDGDLIGMNTMIYSNSGSNAGLGFAVPVDTISRTVPNLIKFKKDIYPVIGIGILEEAITRRYLSNKGIGIKGVASNGPAKRAGLRDGVFTRRQIEADVILEIDGEPVNTYNEINNVLSKKSIGDYVRVKFKRGNQTKIVNMKLAASNEMIYRKRRY